jgi:hypothetical protein
MNYGLLGASILANNGRQPYQTVGGLLGSAYGDYATTMMKQQEMDYLKQYRDLQMQQMQAQMNTSQTEAERMAAYRASLPPELQNAPESVINERAKQQFAQPKIYKAADGYNYWQTGPNANQRVNPGVVAKPDSSRYKPINNRLFDTKTMQYVDTPGSGPDKGRVELSQKVRKEFLDVTKEFPKVSDAYGRILASYKDPTAAGDMAMIFNFMKVLDPGSTVREGEYATAQNAAGWPDRVKAWYNSAKDGKVLSNVQRNDFASRSGMLYNQARESYDYRAKQYTDLAKRQMLDPKNVVLDRRVYPKYETPTEDPKDFDGQIVEDDETGFVWTSSNGKWILSGMK